MRGTMESVTKMALEEMILAHAKESRFGYILNHDDLGELVETLYNFFETSRNLKAAGDKILHQGLQTPQVRSPGRVTR